MTPALDPDPVQPRILTATRVQALATPRVLPPTVPAQCVPWPGIARHWQYSTRVISSVRGISVHMVILNSDSRRSSRRAIKARKRGRTPKAQQNSTKSTKAPEKTYKKHNVSIMHLCNLNTSIISQCGMHSRGMCAAAVAMRLCSQMRSWLWAFTACLRLA